MERQKLEIAELGRYSSHLSIVLSLVSSLAAVAITSRKHLANYLWVEVAAFGIPILIALYFKNRIALLGVCTSAVAIVLALGAAVLFGI